MGLYKILRIVAFVLGIAGFVLWIMILSKGDTAIKASGEGVESLIAVAYITMAIVLLFVVFFVLKGIFQGDIKKTLISLGAFLAVVVIAYVMSTGVEVTAPNGEVVATESTSRWVGTGLKTFYILAFVAVGSMVYSGVKKILSR